MQIKKAQDLTFLRGGGEMGELIRSKDWSSSAIGTPDQWPQSLRTAVSILINSQFPMFVWWGPQLITIYNDAYRIIAGEKHPAALGEPGPKVWAEIWDVVGPLAGRVMQKGESNWAEDQILFINRHGYTEESYFTFSYSPVMIESGEVGGVFCACTETTEKVFAERKLRESERNLRSTILQSPVGMCILRGAEYVVEIANERVYEIWGKGESEMLDRPLFEGLPEAKNQGIEELLKKVMEEGEAVVAHERPVMLPRDGITKEVILNFVYEPFREGDGSVSGIIAVAIDVTEQVQARKKIEESEQELQLRVKERTAELEKQSQLIENILANSSNGISVSEVIRDEKGEIIDATTILANDAAVRFTGIPREVYLGKTAVELEPNIRSSEYFRICVRTLQTGEPALIQYFMEYSHRWLELTVSKMDDDHLIHIFTDVTPIKEAQLQLERMIEELKRSNANLEEFAYAASHDMKEPIRKIHFFSDRLKQELKDLLNEHQVQLFSRMENAAQRMGLLIEDLLAYSHVSRGVPALEEIDLKEKLQNVLEDLEVEVQEKKATVNVGQLPVVKGHRRQVQQLFQNILSNALKYSKPDAAPVINISSRIVVGKDARPQLPAEEGNRKFHLIQITDNGVGFEQKDAERIFNVFTRLHGNTEYRGTGVGLSIAKKVMDNHKGHIWAVGEPEKGAAFNLLFPID
jgi:PAS domain S-box-containing protein